MSVVVRFERGIFEVLIDVLVDKHVPNRYIYCMKHVMLALLFLAGCAVGERQVFTIHNAGVEPEKATAFERAAAWWGVEVCDNCDGEVVTLRPLPADDDVPARAPWWEMEVWVSPSFDWKTPDSWEATMAHEWGHLLAQCSGHLERRKGLMSSPHQGHTVTEIDWDYIYGGCE